MKNENKASTAAPTFDPKAELKSLIARRITARFKTYLALLKKSDPAKSDWFEKQLFEGLETKIVEVLKEEQSTQGLADKLENSYQEAVSQAFPSEFIKTWAASLRSEEGSVLKAVVASTFKTAWWPQTFITLIFEDLFSWILYAFRTEYLALARKAIPFPGRYALCEYVKETVPYPSYCNQSALFRKSLNWNHEPSLGNRRSCNYTSATHPDPEVHKSDWNSLVHFFPKAGVSPQERKQLFARVQPSLKLDAHFHHEYQSGLTCQTVALNNYLGVHCFTPEIIEYFYSGSFSFSQFDPSKGTDIQKNVSLFAPLKPRFFSHGVLIQAVARFMRKHAVHAQFSQYLETLNTIHYTLHSKRAIQEGFKKADAIDACVQFMARLEGSPVDRIILSIKEDDYTMGHDMAFRRCNENSSVWTMLDGVGWPTQLNLRELLIYLIQRYETVMIHYPRKYETAIDPGVSPPQSFKDFYKDCLNRYALTRKFSIENEGLVLGSLCNVIEGIQAYHQALNPSLVPTVAMAQELIDLLPALLRDFLEETTKTTDQVVNALIEKLQGNTVKTAIRSFFYSKDLSVKAGAIETLCAALKLPAPSKEWLDLAASYFEEACPGEAPTAHPLYKLQKKAEAMKECAGYRRLVTLKDRWMACASEMSRLYGNKAKEVDQSKRRAIESEYFSEEVTTYFAQILAEKDKLNQASSWMTMKARLANYLSLVFSVECSKLFHEEEAAPTNYAAAIVLFSMFQVIDNLKQARVEADQGASKEEASLSSTDSGSTCEGGSSEVTDEASSPCSTKADSTFEGLEGDASCDLVSKTERPIEEALDQLLKEMDEVNHHYFAPRLGTLFSDWGAYKNNIWYMTCSDLPLYHPND